MTYPYFTNFDTITLLVLLFGYTIQIFADFAGYSLIAIGIAKLFGYELPKNFNFPYISKSFSEFWRRWHISLSTWLKEYLYIPLGGNRKGKLRTYINLFVVMVLGVFWHGASFSYIVWGGYHGMLLVIDRFFKQYITFPSSSIWNILKVVIVFSLVSIGWLLFKLPDFYQAIEYIHSIMLNNGIIRKDVVLLILFYSLPIFIYYINYIIYYKNEDKV